MKSPGSTTAAPSVPMRSSCCRIRRGSARRERSPVTRGALDRRGPRVLRSGSDRCRCSWVPASVVVQFSDRRLPPLPTRDRYPLIDQLWKALPAKPSASDGLQGSHLSLGCSAPASVAEEEDEASGGVTAGDSQGPSTDLGATAANPASLACRHSKRAGQWQRSVRADHRSPVARTRPEAQGVDQ